MVQMVFVLGNILMKSKFEYFYFLKKKILITLRNNKCTWKSQRDFKFYKNQILDSMKWTLTPELNLGDLTTDLHDKVRVFKPKQLDL